MKENSIEEEIKIALDKFLDNKDKDSAILIVEKFILGNYILRGGRTNIVKYSLRYILSDYKRVLKENEELIETYKSEKKMKNEYVKLYQDLLLKENVVPIQKVKDKIEEYKNMLKTCNKAKDIDRIKAINERILELQELIEGEK